MNYFTIDTIPAVNNYRLFGEDIVYLDNKNRLYLDGILVDTEVDYFDVFEKEIYFERNGKIIEFNTLEKSKKQYFELIPQGLIQDEMFLNIFDSKSENIDLGAWSYRFRLSNLKKTIIRETKNRFILGYGIWKNPYYFHSEVRNPIKCLDILKETYLWQYSVSEIGKYKDRNEYLKPIEKEGVVRKIMGVFGDVLVAQISGGESANEYQLLGLNTQTGKQQWLISGISGVCVNLQANDAQTHLLAIRDSEFIEIDLRTAQISRNKDLESILGYEGKTITVKCMTLRDQHIFFTGSFNGLVFHSGVIGAFNIETEQIDWLHDMEFDRNTNFNMSSTPQLEGNRLYALDSGGTLHIFEREENTDAKDAE